MPHDTTPPAAAAAEGDGGSDSAQQPAQVTEDVSVVVVGKGVPVTRLDVVWEPRRRRLEVRVPASLAAALGGEG